MSYLVDKLNFRNVVMFVKYIFIVFFFVLSGSGYAKERIECLNRKGRWDYPTSKLALRIAGQLRVKTCNGKKFKSFVSKNFPQMKIVTIGETEDSYNESFCRQLGGETEVQRVDCLTKEYAIEVDRAKKWREALGQSLHYSSFTQRKAGIALIISESKKDMEYLRELRSVLNYHKLKIKVWEIHGRGR